jgi:transmembrane sensor
VLLLLASAGAIKWFYDGWLSKQPVAAALVGAAIRPVADKATLTLGDGSIVELEALKDGPVKKDINKQKAQLVYSAPGNEATQPAYNTLTTPRGGLYSVVLSDGTKVWLNAASSLRYPTAFVGQVRQVDLTGEAYFEVAKNPAQPFKVVVNGMEVNVLGTHFNVMAYDDEEAMATTLLEGAVKVGFGGRSVFLTPGQQSLLNKSGGDMQVKTVDPEESVAWKEGLFEFKSEDIRQVMRNVARWYDVDVQYKGVVSDHFSGEVHRDADVYSLLNTMELTHKVHFEVSGRTIIVSP